MTIPQYVPIFGYMRPSFPILSTIFRLYDFVNQAVDMGIRFSFQLYDEIIFALEVLLTFLHYFLPSKKSEL